MKGPALAQQLYGNPAARMFVDLDVLVLPEDLPNAIQVVRDLGYTTNAHDVWTLDQVEVATRSFHVHDVGFRSPRASLRLELHWRGFGDRFYGHGEAALIEALRGNDPAELTVPAATQVLVHGAAHGYRRLGWLRDAAVLGSVLEDEQWEAVLRLADADHAPNSVLLGPYLGHRLFNARLPEPVAQRVLERCNMIRRTADFSTMARPSFAGIEERGTLKFQLLLRDRLRDRLAYMVDKVWRLDPAHMNAKTLRNGMSGKLSRIAAQPEKFFNFFKERLGPRAARVVRRSKRYGDVAA